VTDVLLQEELALGCDFLIASDRAVGAQPRPDERAGPRMKIGWS
jgi:hypothetical protein